MSSLQEIKEFPSSKLVSDTAEQEIENEPQDNLKTPLIGADSSGGGNTKVHEEKKVDATDENKLKLQQGIQYTRRGTKAEQKRILASRATTMDPRHSFGVYPRFDSAFKKKRSLNFDIMQTELFLGREKQSEGWQWLAYLIIGITIGVIAYLMSLFEEWIVGQRIIFAQYILKQTNNSQAAAWAALAIWCFTFCAAGSALTIYVGPGANGSGIADLMAYINGINYTGMIGYNTLIIKIVGVVFGISGALCIGKEGPLAHIGAIVALAVVYVLPIDQFKAFQNDTHKREFVCAGISAGVSAAFASPIGGALFSYEMSKPSTFWTFQMIWKTFFCSSVSTFTLSLLTQLQESGFSELKINSAGTVKFGSLQDVSIPAGQVYGSIVLGVLGGVLGSLFITVNTQMGYLRKKWVTNNGRRIVETGMFGAATISVMALIVINFRKCDDVPPCKPPKNALSTVCTNSELEDYHTQTSFFIGWDCHDGQYSPLATLFFNTEGGTIRNLFKQSDYFVIDPLNLALFGLVWYFFTITTYGVKIPAGLFLPGIIMGGAMGRLWAYGIQAAFSYEDPGEIEQNTILGSAAMLSGYCRLTYSLTVIMLETTQAVNLFIPMMLTMLTSYFTAIYFNQSLYLRALRDKQCPFLTSDIPHINRNLRAQLFMKDPYILPTVPLVSEIEEGLRKGYRVFPLKNLNGQLVGQIPQSFLIILLEKMQWYTGTVQPQGNNSFIEEHRPTEKKLTVIEEEQNDGSLQQSNVLEKPENLYSPLQTAGVATDLAGATDVAAIQSIAQQMKRPGSTKSVGSDQFIDYRVSTKNVDDDLNYQRRQTNMQESVKLMLEKKRTYLHLTPDQLRAISGLEKKAMRDLCRFERRGSETDLTEIPQSDCLTTPIMDWREFNPDFYSSEREFHEVEQICAEHGSERIDLRPYMIFQPYVCFTTDRIQKVLDIFRNFNLRQLCVVSPVNGQLTGVISRQDLFEYLSL